MGVQVGDGAALQNVGCDYEIDSNAVEDRCGVCHGDGSTCHTVKKTFEDSEGLGKGARLRPQNTTCLFPGLLLLLVCSVVFIIAYRFWWDKTRAAAQGDVVLPFHFLLLRRKVSSCVFCV